MPAGDSYRLFDIVGADGLWEVAFVYSLPDGSEYTSRYRDVALTDGDDVPRVYLSAGSRRGGAVFVIVRCGPGICALSLQTGAGVTTVEPTLSRATETRLGVISTLRSSPMILTCSDSAARHRATVDVEALLPPKVAASPPATG
jgi:hypothetical protein